MNELGNHGEEKERIYLVLVNSLDKALNGHSTPEQA